MGRRCRLVARSCLVDNPHLERKCLKIIHLNQPVSGAPKLYRYFRRGAEWKYEPGHGLLGWAADAVFTRILGHTHDRFVNVAHRMQGALQLLPNDAFAGEGQGPDDVMRLNIPDNLPFSASDYANKNFLERYQDETGVTGIVCANDSYKEPWVRRFPQRYEDLKAGLDRARAFHQRLLRFRAPGKTVVLYSAGLDTDLAMRITVRKKSITDSREARDVHVDGMLAPPKLIETRFIGKDGRTESVYEVTVAENKRLLGDGDGTVPVASQRALSTHGGSQGEIELETVEHSKATDEGNGIQMLQKVIAACVHEHVPPRKRKAV